MPTIQLLNRRNGKLKRGQKICAARCLRKPFTPAALMAVINECLSEADAAGPATKAKRLG